MTTVSTNLTTKLILVEAAAPATPASGTSIIYAKADGLLYSKDDAGVETLCSAGAGGMANPLTTTGDMIYSSSGTTPARLAAVATGRVLSSAGTSTAPTWALPPGYQMDFATRSTTASITSTSEASPDTVLTGNAVVYTAVPHIAEFHCPMIVMDTTAGRALTVLLFADSTSIGRMGAHVTPANAADQKPGNFVTYFTPTAATITYSIRAYVNAGTSDLTASAGGAGDWFPSWFRITKV